MLKNETRPQHRQQEDECPWGAWVGAGGLSLLVPRPRSHGWFRTWPLLRSKKNYKQLQIFKKNSEHLLLKLSCDGRCRCHGDKGQTDLHSAKKGKSQWRPAREQSVEERMSLCTRLYHLCHVHSITSGSNDFRIHSARGAPDGVCSPPRDPASRVVGVCREP